MENNSERSLVDIFTTCFSVTSVPGGFFMSYAIMVRLELNTLYERALKTWQHLAIADGVSPQTAANLSVADFKKQESTLCVLNELVDHCLKIAVEKQSIMVTQSTDIALLILAATLAFAFYFRRDVLRLIQYFRINSD